MTKFGRYYPLIDGHADTLVKNYEEGGTLTKYTPGRHLDLPRLQYARVDLQVLAICATSRAEPYRWARRVIDYWQAEYEQLREEMIWLKSRADFEAWEEGGKIGIILALEGLEPLEGKLARLEEFYTLGIRMLSLTWNGMNPFASGVAVREDPGLTPLGKECVERAESLGMILDLSHLGRQSFYDLMELVRKPVCVSHANVYAVHPHRRNLTAEQIRLVAQAGGTIGLTFYPPFIKEGEVSARDLIPHLEYLLAEGGEDCLALGSDWDGIDQTPTDLTDVTRINYFLKVLEDYGFKQHTIRKLAGGNLYRFLAQKFTEIS
ncbi:MAG: membrane dipeptidase [Firmicutes bacterium]|nr:membrane dipeptidase [Bacillota bacterium]